MHVSLYGQCFKNLTVKMSSHRQRKSEGPLLVRLTSNENCQNPPVTSIISFGVNKIDNGLKLVHQSGAVSRS